MDFSANSSSSEAINEGSQPYPYPYDVDPAGFDLMRLSGNDNYLQWKKNMLWWITEHNLVGFIDGTIKEPQKKKNGPKMKAAMTDLEAKHREWKRSDDLVKGWILYYLSEDIKGSVDYLFETANQLWNSLEVKYATHSLSVPMETPTYMWVPEFEEYLPLRRAIHMGDWEKAQEIFSQDISALTGVISSSEYRAIHLAIGNPKNIPFLKNLLEQIRPESLPTLVTDVQRSPLHLAAILDNRLAVKMLVEKNPYLLFTLDIHSSLPVNIAACYSHENTFRYLLKACKQHVELSQASGFYNPFEGEIGALLLGDTILAGFLDVAYDLLKEYPELARTKSDKAKGPLWSLAKLSNVYRSAKRYNFYQRFIYSHVPIEIGLHDANKIEDIENRQTYSTNLVTKCTKSYVYPVIERIIVQLWKLLLQVPHIKHLHEDKVKHKLALTVLEFICREVSKLKSNHYPYYFEAFIEAAYNNTPEVLDQIITTFPDSIWVLSKGVYTFAQISIVNRCENIYNYFVHEVNHDKYGHIIYFDGDQNNLFHLAGKLAPLHKLNLVTGSALRMQRELQWFKEVEKLMRPREREATNINGETPIMVFRKEHKDLRKEGEDWMKKTAESYTITAALIITIVFAAAITVPGGNNGDTGKPVNITKPSFVIFAISDAISLFTSTTSLLLFLSVLTARFAEEDFLYTLPKRLILGLVMLFISVTAMTIAFSATLYIMFGLERSWVLIPIASLTCLPIASFVTLQLPLLVDLIASTYGPGIFRKGSELRITS